MQFIYFYTVSYIFMLVKISIYECYTNYFRSIKSTVVGKAMLF